MKLEITLLTLIFLNSCANPEQPTDVNEAVPIIMEVQKLEPSRSEDCRYTDYYKDLGNQVIDTIMIENWLTDPIDDFTNFEAASHGFVRRGNEVFKKASTHLDCVGKPVLVEFYQDFTGRVDLASFMAYDDRYFTTGEKVYFWWVNSDGHLMLPINDADPKTFKPFQDMCGGIDKDGIYYGCPNFGVYQLDLSVKAKFEFIAKEGNYWNAPQNYVVVNDKVYDIKHTYEKGYFCELMKGISKGEIVKR